MDRNDPDRYGLPRISPAEGSLPSRNTGQIQIRLTQPGRPRMPGRSCGCPGSAPSTPPWPPSAPTPPARPATMTGPYGTRPWPPATGPYATTTSSENTTSPRTWPPGRNGSKPPNDPGAWPSPPTPNCAAATPGRRSSPCVLPNQVLSDTGCDPLHPAADGKPTDPVALIRDLAMQREKFRAVMDERPRLIGPGENHGKAFRAGPPTLGQDAILQPPNPNRRSPPRPESSSSPQSTTSNQRPEANHR